MNSEEILESVSKGLTDFGLHEESIAQKDKSAYPELVEKIFTTAPREFVYMRASFDLVYSKEPIYSAPKTWLDDFDEFDSFEPILHFSTNPLYLSLYSTFSSYSEEFFDKAAPTPTWVYRTWWNDSEEMWVREVSAQRKVPYHLPIDFKFA